MIREKKTLDGQVVFITGGSRGIGRSIALEFAKEGAMVALNYRQDENAAKETLNQIQALGGYGFLIKGDVGEYEVAKNMVAEVVNKFGKIDVLINNAGISKIGLFIDMEEIDFEEILHTNLKGVFNCSHAAVKHMLKRKSGSILNISSIWGEVGASCEVLYSLSKGGINSFTKALARELAPSNIRVNAIAPGVINTEMNNWLSEEERTSLESEIPMNKFGDSEDIGKLAVFLASTASKYITAQIITVDGGLT